MPKDHDSKKDPRTRFTWERLMSLFMLAAVTCVVEAVKVCTVPILDSPYDASFFLISLCQRCTVFLTNPFPICFEME